MASNGGISLQGSGLPSESPRGVTRTSRTDVAVETGGAPPWSLREFDAPGGRPEVTSSGGTSGWELRRAVGRWLRIRADHIEESVGIANQGLDKDAQRRLLIQLAADAEHSWLLVRLLDGHEPMEFNEWRENTSVR